LEDGKMSRYLLFYGGFDPENKYNFGARSIVGVYSSYEEAGKAYREMCDYAKEMNLSFGDRWVQLVEIPKLDMLPERGNIVEFIHRVNPSWKHKFMYFVFGKATYVDESVGSLRESD
jgi:hypothetical protein